jgi:cytoskeleton protein RodZ
MGMQDDSYSFGRYLQNIRLTKQIGLEEISRETRIRIATLIQIEDEDHSKLPEEIYVKGFLAAYARAIGADGDEVFRRYRFAIEKRIAAGLQEQRARKRKGKKRIGFFLLAFLFFGLIALGAHVAIFREGGAAKFFQRFGKSESLNAEKMEATPGTADSATENGKSVNAAVNTPNPSKEKASSINSSGTIGSQEEPKAGKPERLLLRITAVENTRLKIIIDDQKPKEFKLQSGDQLGFEAESRYNLLVGNATGVKMELNDKPITISGRHGQAVNITLP